MTRSDGLRIGAPPWMWLCVLMSMACAGCREVPVDAEPLWRAELLRQRGAELAHGSSGAAPVEEPSAEPLTPAERADLVALEALFGGQPDPVGAALVAVDDAVERDLPVLGSELLRGTALPAAQALVASAQTIEPETELGAALHRQWTEAQALRVRALEAYAAALERGIVEDLVLADALRDQRLAGTALSRAGDAYAAAQRRIDASAEGE